MKHSTPNLISLIGSRICHDLISPIGAITNGLELMQMTGSAVTPEVALISESVGDAAARICFFRVAYGLAVPQQTMSRAEIMRTIKGGGLSTRIKVQWGPLEEVLRSEVRLVFLALQCFESVMPYGGQVTVMRDQDTWIMTGTAEKLRLRPDVLGCLTDSSSCTDVAPADVQFVILPLLLKSEERHITLTQSDTEVTLQF